MTEVIDPEVDEAYLASTLGPPAEGSIQQRMVAILAEMPAIGKNQRNEQQKFMFRGHDDIMNALNPLLAKHGVFIVPDVVQRVTAERTTQRGSTMYEVNLHVRFTFYGASGDKITASTWGEGTDSGDKATNKAMTMAFKNVLNQAFAISSAEFADTDSMTPEETTRGDGGAARAERREDRREFDPGLDLLPGAIRGENATSELTEAMQRLASDLDWSAMLAEVATKTLGPREDWTEEQRGQFYRRWSNSVERMYALAKATPDWQPELGLKAGEQGDGIIIAGFGFGFGHSLSAPLPKAKGAGDESAAGSAAGAEEGSHGQDEPSEQEAE